jgi:DNA-binding NtrC family response regulator
LSKISFTSALTSAEQEVLGALIGKASAFGDAIGRIPAVARSNAPALITGETGTGKELVSRSIHQLSPRATLPFVAVNCGSLAETMLEDHFFGHERGAFTDAHSRHDGLIAHAAGGTVFLDEVDTLPPRGQVTLLRVLQDGTFRRLGSASEQRVDVRFLAATNSALERLVQTGSFRADLYYRLAVFSITLPRLRDRREDILPLAEHFLRKHSGVGTSPPHLSADAQQALLTFDWPGNVRELESTMLRVVHFVPDRLVTAQDLDLPNSVATLPALSTALDASSSYKTQKRLVIDAFQRRYLVWLMMDYKGNVSRAARAAGKDRRDFGKLLRRHRIDRQQFRDSVGARSPRISASAPT